MSGSSVIGAVSDRRTGNWLGQNCWTHAYSDHHVQIAALIGERVALALRNARLYQAEQRRAHAAEELARLRNDFVASVSHELRTPLTAILGYAELLRGHWENLSDAERLLQIDRIVLSANGQHRLVEDLLMLARLDTRCRQ